MKQKLWEKFRNWKLAKKMMLVYVALLGISCSIALAALQVSLNIYDGKLYEKSLEELDFFTQKVNDNLTGVENLSYSIAMDPGIQQQLYKIKSLNYLSAEYSYEMYQLRMLLLNGLNSHEMVKNIVYTDEHKIRFTVGVDCGEIEKEQYDSMLDEFHQARGGYIVQSPTGKYPYLLSGRDILKYSDASMDYLGSLLITCDVSSMIGRQVSDLQSNHSELFVYSEGGMIYQGDEDEVPALPSMEETQGYRVVSYKGQKYFMCYLKSSKNGWMFVNLFPYSEIFGQTMMVRYLLMAGFLVIFLASAFLMKKLADIITKPLDQLSRSMQIVETGNFEGAKGVLSQIACSDESGMLAQEFRVMLDKIDTLIRENYEEQLLLKDTKYKMLQAQINPHFLYNTLNALNWMVAANRNEDAGQVIIELGRMLRASFTKEPLTTVAEDVQLARSYITIQRFRYRNRAEFTIETEGRLEDYLIPHMTLQPLVENAIYHGVENSLECCKVAVKVREEADSVFLEVTNTGPGMTPEELEAVRNFTVRPKGHGIGLNNIRERLNMTFQDSEFSIESRLDRGTAVRIRIPKLKGGVTDV
jgi:two-component system sensor histidine kinase YesM